MVIAIESEQFEPEVGFEAEAEEPLPEIFDQQEFVLEGKSCFTPLFTYLVPSTFIFCYNHMHAKVKFDKT